MGVYEHLMVKVDATYKELKENQSERFRLFRNTQRKAFNHLLFSLDMDDKDINKPMTDDIFGNPYSPEVQLILNLYSMEPPLYAYLNKACLSLEVTELNTLGPYTRVMMEIL